VPLRDAVASVGRELGIPDPGAVDTITNAWPEIVGEAVAHHAHVRSIRDGVCTIVVDAPAWATQLRYVEAQVVERVTACCGPGVVTAVHVVVGGHEEASKFGRREGPRRSP
jgi:predicted nucleic acid-binding Zn ribbon protein